MTLSPVYLEKAGPVHVIYPYPAGLGPAASTQPMRCSRLFKRIVHVYHSCASFRKADFIVFSIYCTHSLLFAAPGTTLSSCSLPVFTKVELREGIP